jgi:hypothetical protein
MKTLVREAMVARSPVPQLAMLARSSQGRVVGRTQSNLAWRSHAKVDDAIGRRDDDLGAARGIIASVLLSALFFLVVWLVVRAI